MATRTTAPASTSIPRPVMNRAGKTAVGLSVLHPIYFGLGLAIAVAAVVWGCPTFQGWHESATRRSSPDEAT